MADVKNVTILPISVMDGVIGGEIKADVELGGRSFAFAWNSSDKPELRSLVDTVMNEVRRVALKDIRTMLEQVVEQERAYGFE